MNSNNASEGLSIVRFQRYKEVAMEYAFLLDIEGITQ
jgi:protease II